MTYSQKRELEAHRNRRAEMIAKIKIATVFVVMFVLFAWMIGNTIDSRIAARCEAVGGSVEVCRG